MLNAVLTDANIDQSADQPQSSAMAAIDMSLIARSEEQLHQLLRRKKNWAAREPGVILVFCIVFTIALLLISLFAYRKFQARRAAKQQI